MYGKGPRGTPSGLVLSGTFLSVLYSFGTLRVLFDVSFEINYLQWLPHCWCRPSPSFPACSRYSRVSRLLNMLPPAEITFDREHACGDVTPRQTGTHAGTSKSPLRRFSNLRRRAHSRAGDPTDSSPRSPVESLITHDNLPCGGPTP